MTDREELLEILAPLVAANTVNPPGNEAAGAAVVAEYLERCGVPYDTCEKAPGRTNIIGRIGSGSPVLLVACHLDTVPVGDGWTSDPFRLRVEGNLAYGRGANDNKAPLAASLLAARRLVESKTPLGGTLLVAGFADEEHGNEYGAKYVLSEAGLTADYAVVPDCGGHMQEIDFGEKGAVFLTVTCRGAAAHASLPAEGVNAITAMASLVCAMSAGDLPSPPHPHFSPATMNIGVISGGSVANIVPDCCRLEVDFRILPGTSPEDIRQFAQGCIEKASKEHPRAEFSIDRLFHMPPHTVEDDNPLARAVQAASQELFGRPMRPLYLGGITLAKEFALAGIPAVGLGPGSLEAAHKVDEWIEIDETIAFADFLVQLTRELLPA